MQRNLHVTHAKSFSVAVSNNGGLFAQAFTHESEARCSDVILLTALAGVVSVRVGNHGMLDGKHGVYIEIASRAVKTGRARLKERVLHTELGVCSRRGANELSVTQLDTPQRGCLCSGPVLVLVDRATNT